MRSEKLQAKLEKQARNKFDRWKKVHDKRFYLRNQEEEMELRVGLAYLKSCMQMYYYDKITIGDYEPPIVMYNDETCYFQLFWPAKEIEFIVEYLPKEDYRAFIDKLNEEYNTGMKSVNSTIRDSLIYNERLIQVNKTRHIPIRGPVGDKEREKMHYMNKENGNIVQAIQLIPGKEERVIKWLNDRKIDFASGKNQSLVIIDAGKENEEGNYDNWIIYDSEKIIVMNNHEFLVNYKEYNGVL